MQFSVRLLGPLVFFVTGFDQVQLRKHCFTMEESVAVLDEVNEVAVRSSDCVQRPVVSTRSSIVWAVLRHHM